MHGFDFNGLFTYDLANNHQGDMDPRAQYH